MSFSYTAFPRPPPSTPFFSPSLNSYTGHHAVVIAHDNFRQKHLFVCSHIKIIHEFTSRGSDNDIPGVGKPIERITTARQVQSL